MVLTRTDLKIKILVQYQGGGEFQPAGILKSVEDFKRGSNAEIGAKDNIEMGSSLTKKSVYVLQI